MDKHIDRIMAVAERSEIQVPPLPSLIGGFRDFLSSNGEMQKMLARQGLVSGLTGGEGEITAPEGDAGRRHYASAVERDTSLEGLFGVSASDVFSPEVKMVIPPPGEGGLREEVMESGSPADPVSASRNAHPPAAAGEALSPERRDGEGDTRGLAWHVYCRDRLPMDLLTLVPLLVKLVNRGE